MTPSRIVVTGGTGFVGRALLARAARRWPGCRLVVPTRRRSAGQAVQVLPTVDLVEADVHDPAAMAGVLGGAQALVHLVAVLHGDAARFERVHVGLPRALVQACRSAGVRRVIHVSALAVAYDAPSLYLRSKAAGEAVWRDSDLEATMLRPSVIFGAEDRFTNVFAALLRRLPVLPLAGAAAQFQPVWVGDVAEAILRSLAQPGGPALIDCAGPQVLSLAGIIAALGRMTGHERPVWPLPEAIGHLQASLMALLPGEAPLSHDNLYSMRVPSVASGQVPGLESLGIRPSPLALLAPHFAQGRR